ncbi:DUF3141 domain-containing protein [Oharaeibacter diazotrophicus]|uniref:Uncharacterized protein DUF3141 n=1 Tax=Oharaeibacter diazotrophicus TaxID=1920512 RepID=A0A4R6R9Z0_9HYPH|nr:DUF3141 domain-containing protein [Oharaeibacter diazotrophicus]TDP82437.1 uncharacterized protein DUF3141 [Oharaeibacter diazotrophicus]BBE72800.1 alpha/beta hydrolase family protein [Pleomorphomonas sp. SM30]GLS76838.1 3-hydroxyalkanoate synthetase [Oharaeibacter diazotrophicus]
MDARRLSLPPEAAFGIAAVAEQADLLHESVSRQFERIGRTHAERARAWYGRAHALADEMTARLSAGDVPALAANYLHDAAERAILTADILRERGENDLAHEAAGTPPVLIYDYEVVVDGRDLRVPVNYMLLAIVPPAGVTVQPWKRPYVIIDPRAGHGAGIGGFKPDSQVGVALRDGHPVYFVAFRPHPEPKQTLADVTYAEGEFLRVVAERHPDAPRPVLVGNCQGGWAALLVAATHPGSTGPVIVNGAPVATWSGRIGENPMRYNGGLLGGVLPALVLSDLGAGEFDGANLVSNFELLNPARNYFGKYHDLFADVDRGRERFLEFERWWGGYHFMNEAEIHWIVEQLFVGNRLARGEARLAGGRPIDLAAIRAPIVVFASRGDNITPPQQALNWIADAYADEHEIKIRGQRIVYMVHDTVGHLGIFVSSSIARREHAEMTSTMKTIEALAPGLYEMVIEDSTGEGLDARFVVSFRERTMDDIRAFDGDHRREEVGFAAVDRVSRIAAEAYEITARPLVHALSSPQSAAVLRALHPARLSRRLPAQANPLAAPIAASAVRIRTNRRPLAAEHPFRRAEALAAEAFEQAIDFARDMRDAWYEIAFLSIWMSPLAQFLGRGAAVRRPAADAAELYRLPEVREILKGVGAGGLPEAVIRMMIVLANARGSVRRDRLERSSEVMTTWPPFRDIPAAERATIIHRQTVIVEFERDAAIAALPRLLTTPEQRRRALEILDHVVGPAAEMEPHTVAAMAAIRGALAEPDARLRVVHPVPSAEAS